MLVTFAAWVDRNTSHESLSTRVRSAHHRESLAGYSSYFSTLDDDRIPRQAWTQCLVSAVTGHLES
jgi:hypothetical protein